MKLAYHKPYFDDYYGGTYADTFRYGFPLERILGTWDTLFDERPRSFADIGCGPGQTLLVAEALLPGADVWGVEVQDIPEADIVHPKVVIADFLEVSQRLKPVDLLYSACSMYVPWNQQTRFIAECLRLAQKAVCFANVYLTDGQGIPEDSLRKVIYRSADAFASSLSSLGWRRVPGAYEIFYRANNVMPEAAYRAP